MYCRCAPFSDVVQSIVGAKGVCRLRPPESAAVGKLVLRAFITSLDEDAADGGGAGLLCPCVRYISVEGLDVLASEALESAILIDHPMPPTAPDRLANVAVALYNVSLQVPGVEGTGVRIHATAGDTGDTGADAGAGAGAGEDGGDGGGGAQASMWSTREAEATALARLGQALVDLGVGLLASQKLIHPFLKAFLLQVRAAPRSAAQCAVLRRAAGWLLRTAAHRGFPEGCRAVLGASRLVACKPSPV